MNARIKNRLFNIPLTVYPPAKTDAAGDVVFDEPFVLRCYLSETTKVITNTKGQEVISGLQIYLPGDAIAQVDVHATLSCLDYDKISIIKKSVYRLPNGAVEVGVVYCP